MTMFFERRSSTGSGGQKRTLLSTKGFTQDLFDDMAAYGLFSDSDDMSDSDSSVTLTGCQDSRSMSQSQRIRVRVSLNPQGNGVQVSSTQPRRSRSKEHSETDTTISRIEANSTALLRRKRAPSPTPSMTSTTSTEETVRPTRKRINVTKPTKKFKEVVPVIHIPDFKEKTFREMSPPRRMADPIVIAPKFKALVRKKVAAPELKKAIKEAPAPTKTKAKAKRVRFELTPDHRDPSMPMPGAAKRL
ncbi:uncharacterized protein GIQ15_04027 [Arthroderma uncinatum]|uniref:uncharacterized protein n=1 Tax=Arthroderma uncinatum TaxID=74035 RepID=UPI00144A4D0A|nr:uncharacterized protein GIQ15_04027 [Arthroderma uncinatum]KAF3481268.1 hypothetical protein GIQ15_04027 [Arthroderma uncinatum]